MSTGAVYVNNDNMHIIVDDLTRLQNRAVLFSGSFFLSFFLSPFLTEFFPEDLTYRYGISFDFWHKIFCKEWFGTFGWKKNEINEIGNFDRVFAAPASAHQNDCRRLRYSAYFYNNCGVSRLQERD